MNTYVIKLPCLLSNYQILAFHSTSSHLIPLWYYQSIQTKYQTPIVPLAPPYHQVTTIATLSDPIQQPPSFQISNPHQVHEVGRRFPLTHLALVSVLLPLGSDSPPLQLLPKRNLLLSLTFLDRILPWQETLANASSISAGLWKSWTLGGRQDLWREEWQSWSESRLLGRLMMRKQFGKQMSEGRG